MHPMRAEFTMFPSLNRKSSFKAFLPTIKAIKNRLNFKSCEFTMEHLFGGNDLRQPLHAARGRHPARANMERKQQTTQKESTCRPGWNMRLVHTQVWSYTPAWTWPSAGFSLVFTMFMSGAYLTWHPEVDSDVQYAERPYVTNTNIYYNIY